MDPKNLFIQMVTAKDNFRFHDSSLGDPPYGSVLWWIYCGISVFLVLFAGIMSGLTLGLMSMSPVDLEVLQASGTDLQKRQAALIHPLVKKQHQLLVTLLLCNAAAMEALPLFLDRMVNPVAAVILSVSFVLCFGEIIPQAVCSRYGLSVGASCVLLVKGLMILSYPIAGPIGKVLDKLLGHEDPLFRRNQLKALVSIHGMDAGRGGELTHDETTIIGGALDLTTKTAEEAMTPVESIFSLDVNTKLNWDQMRRILDRGHSRVPVFQGDPRNIIGVLLVKSLLTVRPEDSTPVSAVSIRRIPRMPADMPLYNVLNEFQKGSSHMAAVVKKKSFSLAHDIQISDEKNFRKDQKDDNLMEENWKNGGGERERDVERDGERDGGGEGEREGGEGGEIGEKPSFFEEFFGRITGSLKGKSTSLEESEEKKIESAYFLKPEGKVIVGRDGKDQGREEIEASFLAKENEEALGVNFSENRMEKGEKGGREREGKGEREGEREREKRVDFDLEKGHKEGHHGHYGWRSKSYKNLEPFGSGWRLENSMKDEEVVGIITLEDVIEELLQEEIVDETDEYIDVHQKIRVAAAIKKQLSVKEKKAFADIPKRHSSSGISIPQSSSSHYSQAYDDDDPSEDTLGSSAP